MPSPPRIFRVLIGLLDSAGNYNGCVLVSEDGLPMPWPHVVIARDPDDVRAAERNKAK